jgi:hypothetical protein
VHGEIADGRRRQALLHSKVHSIRPDSRLDAAVHARLTSMAILTTHPTAAREVIIDRRPVHPLVFNFTTTSVSTICFALHGSLLICSPLTRREQLSPLGRIHRHILCLIPLNIPCLAVCLCGKMFSNFVISYLHAISMTV